MCYLIENENNKVLIGKLPEPNNTIWINGYIKLKKFLKENLENQNQVVKQE